MKARIKSLAVSVALVAACALPTVTIASTAGAAPGTIDAQGSVNQVYVTGLPAGDEIELVDSSNTTVATQTANTYGATLFRNVATGTGYVVKDTDAGTESDPLTVHSDTAAPWDASIYNQPIAASGYQYLTTRDGTQLALTVHLPAGKTVNDGPFPTLIEYAGYGYADPAGPQSGLATIANLMGFAVVDVNMRGTGCSGGAFDYFEALQNLDAYDVIETIATQPWVANHQVGMFGISYGGISQLFAAQLNPPHLAAIAPLSVIDATASTLYPGGILNTGFALSWAQDRVDDAQPATATTGQRWAWKQIQNGDTVCAANQALHPEAVNLIQKIKDNAKYNPPVADPLDPVSFVDKIKMPVFMACQFQDEQTGGHCPELARHMTGTDHKWFTFTNGVHTDSLDPTTFNHLYDFLEIYVAEQAPSVNAATIQLLAPFVYQTALGVPSTDTITLPDDPIQSMSSLAEAKTAFENLPQVLVRFDNGAGKSPTGDTTPGNPYEGFSTGFDSLPAPGTQTRTWYLGQNGALTDDVPTSGFADTYTSDPDALPRTNYTGGTGGGGLWGIASQWKWNWLPHPAGSAAAYETAPLDADTTVLGTGAVKLWVKSSTPDVDLQATISEVDPDGHETFVQNGWLRASARKLSTDSDNVFKRPSTDADPIPSFTAADAEPMPTGEYTELSIPLYYQGHAYRAGTRIRVVISAPNGTQPVWSFDETQPDTGTAEVSIAHSPSMPSSLLLPVVPGVDVPTDQPACPSLRNEPCRDYQAYTNASVALPDETTTTLPNDSVPNDSVPDESVPDESVPDGSTPTSSTSTSTPSVEIGGGSTPAPGPTGAPPTSTPSSTGALPATGLNTWLLVGLGGLFIAAGAVLDVYRRSRTARS